MSDVDTEWIEDTFGNRVQDVDGVDIDDVVSWYESKLNKYGDENMARVAVQADFNSWINAGANTNVRMITIGAQDDPFNDGDVFIGYALCIPDDKPVKLGTVLFRREDTPNVDSIKNHFYDPYTPIEGNFEISSAEPPIGDNAYALEAVENTTVDTFDAEKSLEERKEMIKDFVPQCKITDVADNLSLTNSDGWDAGFGIDMRMIESSYVHQVRKGDNATRLVVQDDSFVEARDLGSDVTGDGEDEGLAGFADSDLVDFGEASFVNLFVTLSATDDGQILMSVYGTDVIEGTEPPSSGSSSDSDSSSSSSTDMSGGAGADEERTI